jgi:two-component system sensor histidine kinase KdpD
MVEVRIPRDLPLVRFDALLIERVLVNLLENASKYTPPGSRVILEAEVLADGSASPYRTTGPA